MRRHLNRQLEPLIGPVHLDQDVALVVPEAARGPGDDAGGTQLNACGEPDFTDPCASDDENLGVALDSFLQVRVTGATTFYVHVVDWGMDARPDLLYDVVISGVN